MAEAKTKPTNVSVTDYLNAIADEQRRADCLAVADLMAKATKEEPKMWGPSIVGFGSYHYKYESGHEGDTCLVGFASRKDAIVLYLLGRDEKFEEQLQKLGKFKMGKGCLYVKKIADIDQKILQSLIKISYANVTARVADAKKKAGN